MQPHKYQEAESAQDQQRKWHFTSLKQLNIHQNLPLSYFTPKLTNKMRDIIDSIRKTRRVQAKKNNYGGESKWIFKTQLTVVSQRKPDKFRESFNKQATLTKIKAHINISQREWQKQSKRLQEEKNKFQYLLNVLSNLKKERIKLKKIVVYFYIRKMKLTFLVKKNQYIDNHLRELNNEITSMKERKQYIREEIERNKKYLIELKVYRNRIVVATEQKMTQIAFLSQVINTKDKKIRQLSIKRLPNQKEIVNCMFLVGILNEQLYILEMMKSFKKQLYSSELLPRKIKNEGKQKQNVQKSNISKDLNDNLLTRKISIDCRGSEIVVFKVFTVIYMHCKTLHLKNLASIMSKTSFFSEQFKHIYDFQQFQSYMIHLIERFKGNEILLKKQEEYHNSNADRLIIVTCSTDIKYLVWILQVFQPYAQNMFCLRIGQNKVIITLLSRQQLKNQSINEGQAVLKVKFIELNKTLAFD